METTTEVTTKVKLSCNHVVYVEGSVSAGDLQQCDRCTASANGKPRHRRIRQVLSEAPSPADERDAADDLVEKLAASIVAAEAVRQQPAPESERIEVIGNIDGDTGDVASYDMFTAQAEHRAMKAWRDGGRVGDAPATPNLNALNAAHAAGQPRSGKRPGKKAGAGTARTMAPRRKEANQAQATKGFGGRSNAAAYSEPELDAYIRKVRADHPTAQRNDELEYAYWVVEIKVSRARWYKAWAATDPS